MRNDELIEKESKINENSDHHFDVKSWKKWLDQSSSFFAGLLDGSVIGILIDDSEEQIILLEKKDREMLLKIETHNDMERSDADIIFKIKEDNIGEILEDISFLSFIDLLLNQKIRVYSFRSESELMDRGYNGFLGRLGINLGGGSCCGGGNCC